MMRICNKCKNELDEIYFAKNQYTCKECAHKNYINHREEFLEYHRKHRAKYPEKRHIINRNYHLNHRIYKGKYINGLLNPNSALGVGVLTEHIIYSVLNDCIKYNTKGNYNSEYDLKSNRYGNINVKSSKLRIKNKYNMRWLFRCNKNSKIPDYYVYLAFNENKSEILHVWIVPGNITGDQQSVSISNSEEGLQRFKQYEVDVKPYNDVYQNLDIYSMPEFCNFNKASNNIECEVSV